MNQVDYEERLHKDIDKHIRCWFALQEGTGDLSACEQMDTYSCIFDAFNKVCKTDMIVARENK